MAANDRFLGGVAPRATPRTIPETSSLRALVSKEDRAFLSQAERMKFQVNAEKGLETKYDLLDNVNLTDLQTLQAVYNMSIRTEELKDDMARYDMHETMLIPNRFHLDPNDGDYHPAPGASPINLYQSASEVDIELVKTASTWVMKYGADYHTENLFWSGAKILHSCTARLREKIEESTHFLPTHQKTGPVYFVVLYSIVLSSTPVSMRAVIRRLEDLKLSSFEGENVKNAASLIRGAVGLLENNNDLPSDMVDIAFKIMKTSSTTEFNTHVTTMRTNHDLKIKQLTLDDLLMNLQVKYNELSLNGEWEQGTRNNEAVFLANLECHSCGQKGRFWRDCPNKNMENVEQRLEELGQQPARSVGGGRRRRGGGYRSRGNNVFRVPPGAGQPHVRRRGPITKRWCGVCEVWGSHATQQHSEAASAQLVATDHHTTVSTITTPPSVTDTTVSTKGSSGEESIDVSGTDADEASLPALLLHFV